MNERKKPSSISQKSYSALLWNYFGTVIRASSQFIIGIILARLLGPEAFGIVATGWLMVSIGNLVADFGLNAALIQCKTITEKDIRFAFTAQVILGATLTLTGFYSASEISAFFHHTDATPIIKAMAFLFLFQSFGQAAGALLRRSLNFKAYQSINIASYLIGYLAIGIPCAYYHLGAWSLVAAQLVQSLTFSVVAIWHTKTPIIPNFKPSSPDMLAFGGKTIGANLSSWGILNLDSIVIGRMLGVDSLGLYNRAIALISTPINTLTVSLQGVLFAASSRTQNDILQLKKGFFASTAVIGLISMPLAATLACVPETIVTAIYGRQWSEIAPILTPLALAMIIHALLAVVGPILMAQNKIELEFRAQTITLVVMIPVMYFSAQQSVQAVAWGVACIYFLRWTLLLYAILPTLNVNWSEFLSIFFWPIICSGASATITFLCDETLQSLSDFPRLIADMTVASLTLLALARLFGKKILHGPHGEYLLAAGRLPILLRRLINI